LAATGACFDAGGPSLRTRDPTERNRDPAVS
jgi:hypothetical protein